MIKFTIFSTKGEKIYEDARSVSLPSAKGRAQILPGHCEAFFSLSSGVVYIERGDGNVVEEEIEGGVFYIKKNEASLVL